MKNYIITSSVYLYKLICFFNFVNQIFRTSEDAKHSLEIAKFKQCKEMIQKIGTIFGEIKNKPFKIIELGQTVIFLFKWTIVLIRGSI